jgi:hypothetical protein
MYTLLLVTTQTFLGQYNSLENCQKAIKAIYVQQHMPFPQYLSKEDKERVEKAIDNEIKYQSKYVCIKV